MSAPPVETTAANGTDLVSWRHCEVHTRSTFNILSLCLSTLVICVWNAVHHDVPRPWTPRLGVYFLRFCGFLGGFFLPELLVLNALDEFIAAREDVNEINKGPTAASPSNPSGSSPGLSHASPSSAQRPSVLSVLTAAYWTEDWRTRPETFQWTMTNAFHANAGGFVALFEGGRTTYLSSRLIKNLWNSCSNVRPLFSAESVSGHGQGGALAKALFCWQLLVFATSCVARRAEHLPLSLLEITTLAHSLCGLAAFALWWHKPHSVDEAVVIPVDESLKKKICWDFSNGPPNTAAMRGISILIDLDESLPKAVLSSLAVGVLYGLPHLIALGAEFPTLAERRCWQVATAILIGEPLFFVVFCWVHNRLSWDSYKLADIIGLGLFPSLYCMASCFIIAESFRQLFALPAGAFLSPAFVCYLPHFS